MKIILQALRVEIAKTRADVTSSEHCAKNYREEDDVYQSRYYEGMARGLRDKMNYLEELRKSME